MVESRLQPGVNAGEEITTPPSPLPLKPDEQFRLVNQRLDDLADKIGRIAKPPRFRTADVVNFVAVVIGIITAIISGFGLSERIAATNTRQADVERRLDSSIAASESRVSSKLDKLSEQFTSVDERTSRVEGQQQVLNSLKSK